jgi:NAD(P)-dependent dehydrogenase (short-subunit alcohol dehydrogenase family)
MSDAVIVTGSSTGLGLETALHLAERGFRVYATVRDLRGRPAVLDAAAGRGVDVRLLELDLTDEASIRRTVDAVVQESGGIFGLVNNGGVGLRGCLEDVTADEVRRVFEANVFGTIAVTQAVLPHMRAAGRGRIVTITSVGGRISAFGVGVYCGSKFAQEGLGEALALEVAPFGVQAVMIEPGIINTTRWSEHRATAAGAQDPSSPYYELFRASEAMANRLVERSRTRPEDVAAAVHHAITVPTPRMRYVVGRPAATVIVLRRYLPAPFFERVYFGSFLRRIRRQALTTGAR